MSLLLCLGDGYITLPSLYFEKLHSNKLMYGILWWVSYGWFFSLSDSQHLQLLLNPYYWLWDSKRWNWDSGLSSKTNSRGA